MEVAVAVRTQEFASIGAQGDTRRRSDAHTEFDDEYLVALAKRGQPDAYERIVRRYRGCVRLKASA